MKGRSVANRRNAPNCLRSYAYRKSHRLRGQTRGERVQMSQGETLFRTITLVLDTPSVGSFTWPFDPS